MHSYSSEVRHRVAACIANLALEHNYIRDILASNKDILSGLGGLLSDGDPFSMDFSLAALANLSIDARQVLLAP